MYKVEVCTGVIRGRAEWVFCMNASVLYNMNFGFSATKSTVPINIQCSYSGGVCKERFDCNNYNYCYHVSELTFLHI